MISQMTVVPIESPCLFSLSLSLLPNHISPPPPTQQMATASTSWMPAAGRHNVSIGSSLSKALKARKGQPPTQRSRNLPERDFYALRCARTALPRSATTPH